MMNYSFLESEEDLLSKIMNSNTQVFEDLVLPSEFANITEVIEETLPHDLPLLLRIVVGLFIIIILIVGTIGNTMIALVIGCSRDMRTSTNFFLVNLSVADLLVLILVTPTALVEVIYHPEIWILGRTLCYLVPVLEMTVCHASVLTILAISFERYYAICSPLKANYVCTRARAAYICLIVWIVAVIITSPMFFMTHYYEIPNNGVIEPTCIVGAGTFWPDLYTVTSICMFFFIPLIMMIGIYAIIARQLTQDRSALNAKNENTRGRKQVVLMLGTVVFTFFLCLLPFRILTLVVLLSDYGDVLAKHTDAYYTINYFARILCYTNSALNPILYNMMSSKFRNGFLRLFRRKRKQFIFHRNGTFLTLTTTTSHTLSLGNNNTVANHTGVGRVSSTPSQSATNSSGSGLRSNDYPPNGSPSLKSTNTGTNAGLIRKNGIRKGSYPQLLIHSQHSRHQNHQNLQRSLHYKNIRTSNHKLNSSSSSKTIFQQNSRSSENNLEQSKTLNPRSLSKRFIYSYVSGFKNGESML